MSDETIPARQAAPVLPEPTARVVAAVAKAHEVARDLRRLEVDTVSLIAALADDDGSIAAEALIQAGADPKAGLLAPRALPPMSARVEADVDRARRIASACDANYAGVEHLLAAVLLGDPDCGDALWRCGESTVDAALAALAAVLEARGAPGDETLADVLRRVVADPDA